jgi:lipopolysaccharide heptosyltransferase III
MNILLVRLRLIGDVVFTTPMLRALRRRYPDARLTYLVESAAAPVLRHNPHLTELIVIPRRSGLRRLRDDLDVARDLRRRRFDLAIDLHGGPRAAWLTWASGAPRRIGYAMPGRAWMYTDAVTRAPDLSARHSVENQWDLLTPLAVGPPDASADAVEMGLDVAAAARVDVRLRGLDVSPVDPVIVVHVSAGNPFRRWPESSFAALIALLVRHDPSRRVVVTSGPSDAAAARRVLADARRQLGAHACAVLDIGDLDLPELHALTDRAAVYIGGDSGPAHIAATTQTPVVELLGPTLAGRSRPWRDPQWYSETVDAGELPCRPCSQRRCVPGDFRCLTGIAPEQVAAAAERALHLGAATAPRTRTMQRTKELQA